MPNRDLNTTLSKFAAGNLAGYKGAQPNRFPRMTVMPAAAPDAPPPLCFEETLVESFPGAAGAPLGAGNADLPWGDFTGSGPPFGFTLDGSGNLTFGGSVTDRAQLVHMFNARGVAPGASGLCDFQIDYTVTAWTLSVGAGGAFDGAYTGFGVVARSPSISGGDPETSTWVNLYIIYGVGDLATGPTWQLADDTTGTLATVAHAPPSAGDVVSFRAVGDHLEGLLNGVPIITATCTPKVGNYVGLLGTIYNNGTGTHDWRIGDMTISNFC